jgi:hypothetical protein
VERLRRGGYSGATVFRGTAGSARAERNTWHFRVGAKLYESLTAWPFVARTWIQTAEILVETEPARALDLVEGPFRCFPASRLVTISSGLSGRS